MDLQRVDPSDTSCSQIPREPLCGSLFSSDEYFVFRVLLLLSGVPPGVLHPVIGGRSFIGPFEQILRLRTQMGSRSLGLVTPYPGT